VEHKFRRRREIAHQLPFALPAIHLKRVNSADCVTSMTMKLVLASASPRRQELLKTAGIAFTVKPSHVPEEIRPGELPKAYSERLASDKANAVWQSLSHETRAGSLVLGADTIVIVDQHILEKPADNDDAKRMLRMLSGRTHQVMTTICLIGNDMRDLETATTEVRFADITESELDFYVSTGEHMDKAGAYAIQGVASRWIPRIDGDYTNVVGLPIPLVYEMLRKHQAI
jgi:septum formation protein